MPHRPGQHTHTHPPFPPPCSMSPLPPFQSSTLSSLSLFHLGRGDLVNWLPCPRSGRLSGFSTAVLYIMYHTDEGWGALFFLSRINTQKANCMSMNKCRWVFLCVFLHEIKNDVSQCAHRDSGDKFTSFPHQNGGTEGEKDDDGKKSKRRPRPEPLFIPPPKPGLFIAPPVYSSITPYQSHLRSPVRLADNPLTMPPYTPPPILSPVREGSGLYFSTFLSSAAASGQGLPPPATPKSATRSLLRSSK